MDSVYAAIFTGANTLGLLALAFKAGGYVRRIEANEERLKAFESSKTEVAIARLEEKVDGMQDQLHGIADYLMINGGNVRKATAGGH
jgi:hypothetical protein